MIHKTKQQRQRKMCSAFLRPEKSGFVKIKYSWPLPYAGPVLVSLNPAPAPALCLRCARISSIRLFFSCWSRQITVRTQTHPSFLFQEKQQYVAVCKILAPQTVFNMNTVASLDYFEFYTFTSGYSLYISCASIPTICNIKKQYIAMHYTTFTLHYTICINLHYAA